jgi:hypothetical protein
MVFALTYCRQIFLFLFLRQLEWKMRRWWLMEWKMQWRKRNRRRWWLLEWKMQWRKRKRRRWWLLEWKMQWRKRKRKICRQ